MTRLKPFSTARLLGIVSLAALGAACAPTVGIHGFQNVDAAPTDIVAGTDTKQTVRARLGSPSTTSTFESDAVWYYISQTTEKYTYNLPKVSQRSVTEITFDSADQVAAVRTFGLEDGRDIDMLRRTTPTRGRELSVLEQLLGTIGRSQLPRTEDELPGQRRPD
ncbi:outer membrane protein assembly factor BamE [uncultured Brevundimonas sp.]|uniref:outer membrane protein assembly factor BamE n=1 Tax=uncultured Brevundimonas sp. TaxID=213418 RepID=UPI0030EC51A3|tara:strand:- start:392 stop:883 length:492 start_codon:yes stop_codon:yes gene_type:complete